MAHAAAPRIVISGIGVVSPFGVGRERFWDHVSRGCSGTRAIVEFDASDLDCQVAAPVTGVSLDDVPAMDGDDIRAEDYRADPKRYSRTALIGVIAAREAWADAGLRIAEANAGVVIGSGGGGIDVGERNYHDFFLERGRKVTPYAIPVSIVGMLSSELSISLRLRGVSHVLSCGCTSSTDAIGYAAALLRAAA
jgi:3-oxoacyl-[acyl-carrier-protein] synthase II